MSFDTVVSVAFFAGAIFLMMRFGCGVTSWGTVMAVAHPEPTMRRAPRAVPLMPRWQQSARHRPPRWLLTRGQARARALLEASRNAHRHGCC